MALTRLLISLFELALMIVLAGVVIILIYRGGLKTARRIDIQKELQKGNVALGILMATIMISLALLLQKGLGASVNTFKLTMAAPDEMAIPLWLAGLLILAHLILSLALAVIAISLTLRLIGTLERKINPEMPYRQHLIDGNVAVGLVVASFVLITTLFVGDGISAVTKALVPQPKIGTIQIME